METDVGTIWAKVLSALVVLGLLFSLVTLAWGWWDSSWQYRTKLTFDNWASSENLTSFPVLVHLTSTQSDFWDHINSSIATDDTKDLRFVDADDSAELFFEAEEIDYPGQDALIWVKVPQIDAGSTTDFIYLYYGNPSGAQSSCHSSHDVWDSDFIVVQHMNESSGGAEDSTYNDNDGNAVNISYLEVGQIGYAYGFLGDSGESRVEWSSTFCNFDYDDSFTLDYWQKTDMGSGFAIAKGDGKEGYCVETKKDGDIEVGMEASGVGRALSRRVNAGAEDNAWHHIVITYDGSRDVSGLKIYVDGSEPTTQSTKNNLKAGDSMATALVFYLGRSSGTPEHWYEGETDEFRISNRARSADWIKAQYLSMTDQFIDIIPPVSSVDALPTFTTSLSFSVGWSGSDDGGSGIKHYDVQVKDGSGGTWTDWITETTDTSAIYTGEDGRTYYFQCRAQDNAGNWESYPGGDGDTHTTIDTTAPTGSVSINSGADYSNSTSVILTLSATSASQMQFSNDTSSWSDWETYATERTWSLTSGDGTKTVYVKFKDSAGNVSGILSDTIELDTTPPSPTMCSVSIKSGAAFANSRSVILNLSASDSPSSGISQMMISNSSSFDGASWEEYTTSKSWTLSSGEGEKIVYVKFKDGAGNMSEVFSDVIILDTAPPRASITSPSSGVSVRGEVIIRGTASDENFEVYVVEYGYGSSPSSWTEIVRAFSSATDGALATWNTSTLSDGSYTLRLSVGDLAGNWTQTKVTLRVDNHPPEAILTECPTETVTGNTPKVPVTFAWAGSDPGGITPVERLVYQHKMDGHLDYQDWSEWTQETTKIYMLPSGDYTFKVRAKDEAGNYPQEDDPGTARCSVIVSLPIIAYPNPCYPNQGQIVTIANLPSTSEVKISIYDVAGSLVRTLGQDEATLEGGSKTAVWDLRNDDGDVVARGIYIYLITGATEKKRGKIAIMK